MRLLKKCCWQLDAVKHLSDKPLQLLNALTFRALSLHVRGGNCILLRNADRCLSARMLQPSAICK